MKNFKYFLAILTISLITSSCGLFKSGGSGGGHCPAYGANVNFDDNKDLNTPIELRERFSKSM
jgi:hypothetical protein